MQGSGICSRRITAPVAARGLLLAALAAGVCLRCEAKVFMTQEEALKLAFPAEAAMQRQTAYLTETQAAQIEMDSGTAPPTKVIVYYTAADAGGALTAAWFDTHIVRTLPETVMVVIGPDAAITRIDILSFDEPQEYLPRGIWMDQLKGRRLTADLSLRQGIRPMAGATLSARAIVEAARRTLALHKLLIPAPAPAAPPEGVPRP